MVVVMYINKSYENNEINKLKYVLNRAKCTMKKF